MQGAAAAANPRGVARADSRKRKKPGHRRPPGSAVRRRAYRTHISRLDPADFILPVIDSTGIDRRDAAVEDPSLTLLAPDGGPRASAMYPGRSQSMVEFARAGNQHKGRRNWNQAGRAKASGKRHRYIYRNLLNATLSQWNRQRAPGTPIYDRVQFFLANPNLHTPRDDELSAITVGPEASGHGGGGAASFDFGDYDEPSHSPIDASPAFAASEPCLAAVASPHAPLPTAASAPTVPESAQDWQVASQSDGLKLRLLRHAAVAVDVPSESPPAAASSAPALFVYHLAPWGPEILLSRSPPPDPSAHLLEHGVSPNEWVCHSLRCLAPQQNASVPHYRCCHDFDICDVCVQTFAPSSSRRVASVLGSAAGVVIQDRANRECISADEFHSEFQRVASRGPAGKEWKLTLLSSCRVYDVSIVGRGCLRPFSPAHPSLPFFLLGHKGFLLPPRLLVFHPPA